MGEVGGADTVTVTKAKAETSAVIVLSESVQQETTEVKSNVGSIAKTVEEASASTGSVPNSDTSGSSDSEHVQEEDEGEAVTEVQAATNDSMLVVNSVGHGLEYDDKADEEEDVHLSTLTKVEATDGLKLNGNESNEKSELIGDGESEHQEQGDQQGIKQQELVNHDDDRILADTKVDESSVKGEEEGDGSASATNGEQATPKKYGRSRGARPKFTDVTASMGLFNVRREQKHLDYPARKNFAERGGRRPAGSQRGGHLAPNVDRDKKLPSLADPNYHVFVPPNLPPRYSNHHQIPRSASEGSGVGEEIRGAPPSTSPLCVGPAHHSAAAEPAGASRPSLVPPPRHRHQPDFQQPAAARYDRSVNGNKVSLLANPNSGRPSELGSPYRPAVSPANFHGATADCRNLYIRRLSPEATNEFLFELCSRFGPIVSTRAVIDRETDMCRGFGFVDFETAEGARRAMDVLPTEGFLVQIAKHQGPAPPPPRGGFGGASPPVDPSEQTNLYIANLPQNYTWQDLANLLGNEGTVISTRVLTNNNDGRGLVGFARMENRQACERVINKFNSKPIEGSSGPLVVKFADVRKSRNEGRFSAPYFNSAACYFDSNVGRFADNGPMNGVCLSTQMQAPVDARFHHQNLGYAYTPSPLAPVSLAPTSSSAGYGPSQYFVPQTAAGHQQNFLLPLTYAGGQQLADASSLEQQMSQLALDQQHQRYQPPYYAVPPVQCLPPPSAYNAPPAQQQQHQQQQFALSPAYFGMQAVTETGLGYVQQQQYHHHEMNGGGAEGAFYAAPPLPYNQQQQFSITYVPTGRPN